MKATFITKLCVATLVAVAVSAGPLSAQTKLDGAWKIVEASGHNSKGDWTWSPVQPSLFLFLDGYYSIMLVRGDKPRPLMADTATRGNITEAEMRSIFTPFNANSGTYKVSGSTVTTKPMVALWPNFMESGSASYDYRIEDGMLILTEKGEGWGQTIKLSRLR